MLEKNLNIESEYSTRLMIRLRLCYLERIRGIPTSQGPLLPTFQSCAFLIQAGQARLKNAAVDIFRIAAVVENETRSRPLSRVMAIV